LLRQRRTNGPSDYLGRLLKLDGLPSPATLAQGIGYGLGAGEELVPRFVNVEYR
jgi:hypothetical protein